MKRKNRLRRETKSELIWQKENWIVQSRWKAVSGKRRLMYITLVFF